MNRKALLHLHVSRPVCQACLGPLLKGFVIHTGQHHMGHWWALRWVPQRQRFQVVDSLCRQDDFVELTPLQAVERINKQPVARGTRRTELRHHAVFAIAAARAGDGDAGQQAMQRWWHDVRSAYLVVSASRKRPSSLPAEVLAAAVAQAVRVDSPPTKRRKT